MRYPRTRSKLGKFDAWLSQPHKGVAPWLIVRTLRVSECPHAMNLGFDGTKRAALEHVLLLAVFTATPSHHRSVGQRYYNVRTDYLGRTDSNEDRGSCSLHACGLTARTCRRVCSIADTCTA
jgi:hypothetical protein